MNRILAALMLLALSFPASAEVWQARYGVGETFNFKLYNADGTLDVDEADGGTEVSLSCNEGAETTATNDFVDEGTFYSIALTAAEMQCERIAVVIAATTTEVFFIQTIDNTSAMTPTIVQTGDSFARLGAPAGASISADVAAVKTDTAAILVDTSTTLDDFVDDLESRLGTPSNLGGGATVAANLSDIEAQTDDIGVAGAGLTAIDLPNQTMDITGTISTVTSVTNLVTANMTQISGDSAAADKLETAFDLTAGPVEPLGIVRQGTAQSASATGLVLDSSAAFADDTAIGMTLVACGSTQGYCQARNVTDNALTGDAFTVDTWTVTPSGTITYYLFGTAPSSGGGLDAAGVRAAVGLSSANLDTQLAAIDDYVDTEVAAILVDTSTTLDDLVDDLESRLGTPSNLGSGATVAANLSDIEGQTDDIGAAGAGLTAVDDAVLAAIEQTARADAAIVNCTVNTANFAGSTTTVACILTDRADTPITAASNDLEGRELLVLSGAQIYEGRFITDSTWDGANSELRLTLSRALPDTLADAVTAIIR